MQAGQVAVVRCGRGGDCGARPGRPLRGRLLRQPQGQVTPRPRAQLPRAEHLGRACGIEHPDIGWRIGRQQLRGTDGTAAEIASAVRTSRVEHGAGTVATPRAFHGADPNVIRVNREVAVAALAVRPQLQHPVSVSAATSSNPPRGSRHHGTRSTFPPELVAGVTPCRTRRARVPGVGDAAPRGGQITTVPRGRAVTSPRRHTRRK